MSTTEVARASKPPAGRVPTSHEAVHEQTSANAPGERAERSSADVSGPLTARLSALYLGVAGRPAVSALRSWRRRAGGECRERVFGQQGLCPVYARAT